MTFPSTTFAKAAFLVVEGGKLWRVWGVLRCMEMSEKRMGRAGTVEGSSSKTS
jgi:hypothetical protein